MAKTALYDIADKNLQGALASFLQSLLADDNISAVMVPMRQSGNDTVMQTLVTDPEQLSAADPFSPAFPMNAARLVSRLTKRSPGETVATVLRPCEIRAHIELVKLKQGQVDDIIIIGIDCPGTLQNNDFRKLAGKDPESTTDRFLTAALDGKTQFDEAVELPPACKICTHPVPEGADIGIGIFGMDIKKQFLLSAGTEKGEGLLDRLGLNVQEPPDGREEAVGSIVSAREASQGEVFAAVHEKTDTPEKLAEYLSGCINCYNCRVACPVCYCRECVFVTDVFDHDPFQYLRWAKRRGKIRMPTDTVFYHLTRMAHMTTACVGCGQCSNACPNDIPLAELFSMTASHTQNAFDYEAGRSLEEDPPLAVFREDEFAEVVEIKH